MMERFDHQPCPKCWNDEYSLRYVPAEPEHPNLFSSGVSPATPEHLEVECRRCGFLWWCAPKDAKYAEEAPT